jgi:hypothetical protein
MCSDSRFIGSDSSNLGEPYLKGGASGSSQFKGFNGLRMRSQNHNSRTLRTNTYKRNIATGSIGTVTSSEILLVKTTLIN